MGKAVGVFYGVASYVVFLLTFLYSIAFVGNLSVEFGGRLLTPRTIDVGPDAGAFGIGALLLNLVLLGVFALQHSVMARPEFKKAWTKVVPKSVERSTYVLVSSGALILMFRYWRPMTDPVWDLSGSALGQVLVVVFWLGWLKVLLSTFMIDHFELFGLRQVFSNMAGKSEGEPRFLMRGLYKLCRHPIMLGFLIAFWSAPVMTLGHLVFSVMTTAYVFVALFFEEKDLVEVFGDQYRNYQANVAKVLPLGGLMKSGRK